MDVIIELCAVFDYRVKESMESVKDETPSVEK